MFFSLLTNQKEEILQLKLLFGTNDLRWGFKDRIGNSEGRGLNTLNLFDVIFCSSLSQKEFCTWSFDVLCLGVSMRLIPDQQDFRELFAELEKAAESRDLEVIITLGLSRAEERNLHWVAVFSAAL